MNRPPLPPQRPRQPSVNDVVERLEEFIEEKTLPGVGRRMNSIRVGEIVEAALDRRELRVRKEEQEKRDRLHQQVVAGVIVGVVMLVVTAVGSYLAGHAAHTPQPSPPAAAAHP